MSYRRRISTADAIQLQHAVTLHTAEGDVAAQAGDWLITEGDQQRAVSAAQFDAEWEPADVGLSWPTTSYPQWVYPYLHPQWQWQWQCMPNTTTSATCMPICGSTLRLG